MSPAWIACKKTRLVLVERPHVGGDVIQLCVTDQLELTD